MHFDEKAPGTKGGRDRSFIRSLISHAIMASGISTIFSSSDPIELCDRIKFLLQATQAGNISNEINEEIVAIVDKFLEYNRISTTQQKLLLSMCLNYRKNMKLVEVF